MNSQNVTLKSQVIQDFEPFGSGGMLNEPRQIGEWWVMPADQYTGRIPPEVMQKWENFKALNVPVLGYLIADDMREVLAKREQEAEAERQKFEEAQRQQMALVVEEERRRMLIEQQQRELEAQRRREEFNRTVLKVGEVTGQVIVGVGAAVGAVVVGVAALTLGVIGAILRFDPVLVAVLPDGRWIAIASWWE